MSRDTGVATFRPWLRKTLSPVAERPGGPRFSASDLEWLPRLLEGDPKLTGARELHAANVSTGPMLKRRAGKLSAEDLRALLTHPDPAIREVALPAFGGLSAQSRPNLPRLPTLRTISSFASVVGAELL